VGFGPDAPQTLCGAGGTPYSAVGAGAGGCVEYVQQALQGDYVMSSSSSNAVPGANVFAGVGAGNQVTFRGIPILPPGAVNTGRVFRITNIRTNANTFPPSTQVSASITSSALLPDLSPPLPVGFVQPGLTFQVLTPDKSAVLTTPDFSGCTAGTKCPYGILRFSENFGTAFKTRVVPLSSTVGSGQATNSTGQNIPGQIYNSESGFISSLITGTQYGAVAGLADFGTRLKAEFSNIPLGATLYVATSNIANLVTPPPGNACTSFFAQCTSFAQLVTSETAVDSDGSTPSVTAAGPIAWNGTPKLYYYAPLAVGSGPVTAVWEVVNASPYMQESFDLPVWIVFGTGVTPAAVNIAGSVAPNPDNGGFPMPDGGAAQNATYPVQRFASSGATAQSIIDDVYRLRANGAITMNPNSLVAKLNNAMADRKSGKCNTASNVYGAFINEVTAQTGKGITKPAATILITDAQFLQLHCF
jgi:hypothetical protein